MAIDTAHPVSAPGIDVNPDRSPAFVRPGTLEPAPGTEKVVVPEIQQIAQGSYYEGQPGARSPYGGGGKRNPRHYVTPDNDYPGGQKGLEDDVRAHDRAMRERFPEDREILRRWGRGEKVDPRDLSNAYKRFRETEDELNQRRNGGGRGDRRPPDGRGDGYRDDGSQPGSGLQLDAPNFAQNNSGEPLTPPGLSLAGTATGHESGERPTAVTVAYNDLDQDQDFED